MSNDGPTLFGATRALTLGFHSITFAFQKPHYLRVMQNMEEKLVLLDLIHFDDLAQVGALRLPAPKDRWTLVRWWDDETVAHAMRMALYEQRPDFGRPFRLLVDERDKVRTLER